MSTGTLTASGERLGRRSGSAAPVLDPRPGGAAERFAGRLRSDRPAIVFLLALIAGFAVAAVVSIGIGLLVTDVVVKAGGIGSADEGFVHDLVAERTGLLTDVSVVGSDVGSFVLVGISTLVAIFFAFRRQWRVAAFAAFVPLVESGLYRVTSLADPRHRPEVARLEDLPVNASYPSGHTAASIAVYGGLVLLLTSRISDMRVRVLAWAAAVLIPLFVAFSRMYRGMHHPIDVAGGVVVGCAAIGVLLFACRAAGAADQPRSI